MSSGRKIVRPVTEEDIRKWEKSWSEMMVKIWTENILRLGIVRTGSLLRSLSHQETNLSGQITIAHQFLLYGIFVGRGTGKGYRRGNSGKDDENGLRFLDKKYRKAHKLGKPRKKREWWLPRYLSSIEVLSEVERNLYGEAYMGTLSNVVQAMSGNFRLQGSGGTDVTHALTF